MTTVIFAMIGATLIFLAGFASFASSTYFIFKKDFQRQAADQSANACLAYGDLLLRAKTLTDSRGTTSTDFLYAIGTISAADGKSLEQLRCRIRIDNEKKIVVSFF